MTDEEMLACFQDADVCVMGGDYAEVCMHFVNVLLDDELPSSSGGGIQRDKIIDARVGRGTQGAGEGHTKKIKTRQAIDRPSSVGVLKLYFQGKMASVCSM